MLNLGAMLAHSYGLGVRHAFGGEQVQQDKTVPNNFPFLTHFRKVNVHHDRYLLISILPTTCLALWLYALFDQL